jgi:transcription elongation factor GreA
MADSTLAQAASQYLSTVSPAARNEARGDVSRFIRWYSADRLTSELRGHDVALYGDSLGQTTPDLSRRLEAVRSFLVYLKKQGLTKTNLAIHLRVRKAAAVDMGSAPVEKAAELSAEGHAALEAELKALVAQRPAVADELKRAMSDKDFRENAPLDAAREKQAHLESRIRQIETVLRGAVVREDRSDRIASQVRLGSTVILRNVSSEATARYTIVGPSEANAQEGKISDASPMGRALLKRREGEEVEVEAPAGVMRFRIERIEG